MYSRSRDGKLNKMQRRVKTRRKVASKKKNWTKKNKKSERERERKEKIARALPRRTDISTQYQPFSLLRRFLRHERAGCRRMGKKGSLRCSREKKRTRQSPWKTPRPSRNLRLNKILFFTRKKPSFMRRIYFFLRIVIACTNWQQSKIWKIFEKIDRNNYRRLKFFRFFKFSKRFFLLFWFE